MSLLTPEVVEHDSEPIDEASKRVFIRRVTETFRAYYAGATSSGVSDIDDHMKRLKEFEHDESATINYIYGALAAANLSIDTFIDATGLLETTDEQ